MTMITLYGIPNCDTVKRARAFLSARGAEVQFHDFKKQGVPLADVKHWLKAVGRDKLVNRQGTTWRKLDATQQARAATDDGALALMADQASVIKRPVVRWPDGSITVGFDEAAWSTRL